LKTWIEIGGALLMLIGVLIGVYGTFLMTKFYHPYGPLGFAVSLTRMLGRTLTGQQKKNEIHADVAAAFADLTPEKKGESLSGASWLFIGFFFQTIGAILTLIDIVIANFCQQGSPT
jgi:hypothetical protein